MGQFSGRVVFIGEFPPPYGGVTVKNVLLNNYVFNECNKKVVDLMECKRKLYRTPIILTKLILYIIACDSIVIAVGSITRRKILLSLVKFLRGQGGMRKCSLIVMGGDYCEAIKRDPSVCMLLKEVNSIWVESVQMINKLKMVGIRQGYLFPNCRTDEGSKPPRTRSADEKLKLVFFSRICKEKGVDDIITAYNQLDEKVKSNITFDIYGDIEDDIRGEFEEFTKMNKEVMYHGVFDVVNEDVYSELNQYDVMLFPSHWKGEGISGALIESKMAGITCIASDWNYNSEVVMNDVEGIVISPPMPENLVCAIRMLCSNKAKLEELKNGAFESRNRYCIKTYKNKLINCVFK